MDVLPHELAAFPQSLFSVSKHHNFHVIVTFICGWFLLITITFSHFLCVYGLHTRCLAITGLYGEIYLHIPQIFTEKTYSLDGKIKCCFKYKRLEIYQ